MGSAPPDEVGFTDGETEVQRDVYHLPIYPGCSWASDLLPGCGVGLLELVCSGGASSDFTWCAVTSLAFGHPLVLSLWAAWLCADGVYKLDDERGLCESVMGTTCDCLSI